MSLKGKTVFITGAGRGIGRAIALAFAKKEANVACFSRNQQLSCNESGSICEVVEQVEKYGGKGLVLSGDVRNSNDVEKAFRETVKQFNGVDVVVNNAAEMEMPRDILNFSLDKFNNMVQTNLIGTVLCTQHSVPHLKNSTNPHLVCISPPIKHHPKWFNRGFEYSFSKFGVSLYVLGMKQSLRPYNIAINSLWPKSVIYTSGIEKLYGSKIERKCRRPDIMADAVLELALKDSKLFSGHLLYDEDLLKLSKIHQLDKYASAEDSGYLLPCPFVEEGLAKPEDAADHSSSSLHPSMVFKNFIEKINRYTSIGIFDKYKLVVNFKVTSPNYIQEWCIDLSENPRGCYPGCKLDPMAVNISLDTETLRDIVTNKTDPYTCYMLGKLKVQGRTENIETLTKFFKYIL